MLLNNQQITEENKKEIKICIETNENENTNPVGHYKSSAKRKVHSNTGIPQETRSQINNLTLHLKQLEKEEMGNPELVEGKKS